MMPENVQHPWLLEGYSEIAEASAEAGSVSLRFANGDTSVIGFGELGFSAPVDAASPIDDGTAVRLAVGRQQYDIGWTSFRALSDPEFARSLDIKGIEESRRVGRRLLALREDRRISKQKLATEAGISTAALTKLERGEGDLRVGVLRRLLASMGAGFADIAGSDAPELSTKVIARSAGKSGVPESVVQLIAEASGRRELLDAMSELFAWPVESIRDDSIANAPYPAPVRFKEKGRDVEQLRAPLVHLAWTLSKLVADVTTAAVTSLPKDPDVARAALLQSHGTLNLESLVAWAWDQGIVVLPLPGAGDFVAAAWSIDGRPVIVVQDNRKAWVHWIFDLAHELGHHALGHVGEAGLIDVSSPAPEPVEDEIESQANVYALRLLLGDYEALVASVRDKCADDPVNKFKFAVRDVAEDAHVDAGVLGFVSAYELNDLAEAKDRWGSSTNLAKQTSERSGRAMVEDAFKLRVDLASVAGRDGAILQALTATATD